MPNNTNIHSLSRKGLNMANAKNAHTTKKMAGRKNREAIPINSVALKISVFSDLLLQDLNKSVKDGNKNTDAIKLEENQLKDGRSEVIII